ncbi:MAG: alpha/beta fold hydrolase [Bacteroidia bacterium]|nr:alpha/beta fold hydrolase [Bacteroidia bacterium]
MIVSRQIDVPGARLYSEAIGSVTDTPVLLLMGAMASGLWWPEQFCRVLAARGRFVLRYDHRDTGGSTKYPLGEPGYTVEDMADDAIAVLGAFEITRAHLVGMSLGGFLAQLIALKHPAHVSSLTLIASEPLGPGDPDIPGIDERVLQHHLLGAELDWSDRAAVVDFSTEGWRLLNGSAHAFDEAHIRHLAEEEYDRSGGSRSFMNHAFLSGGERWFGRLNEIRVPTLIIHGTDDIVLRYENAHALQQQIPSSRLLTLQGSGHELHPADWETVVSAIEAHTV